MASKGIIAAIVVIIIVIIIVFIVLAFVFFNRSDNCDGPCTDELSSNIYVNAPPYFNPNLPYYSNGSQCVKFIDPLNVTVVNDSNMNVNFIAEKLGSDSSCSENTSTVLWSVPQNKSFTTKCTFARLGQLAAWFNGLSMICNDTTNSNNIIPISFQGTDSTTSAVSISVTDTTTQGISINITGNTKNGDALTNVDVVSL